jgi:uncharacterized membrane protein
MEILDMAVRLVGPVMVIMLFVMAWPMLRSWR